MRRCTFVSAHSTSVKKPPQVDLVISETLGNFALEENIIETLGDARRFLKPGGVMIPQELAQFVAPVTSPRLYDELNVWEGIGHDLDFAAAKHVCMNNMYVKDIRPEDSSENPLRWDQVDFTKKNKSVRAKTVEWTVKSNLTLYGFALWWECTLINNVTISTAPAAEPTHWKQIYLPLVDPIAVKKGQTVRLKLASDSRYAVKINVTWDTTVLDGKGNTLERCTQDMRSGHLQ
jgi:protein arginine N-methyltransferase 1